MSASNRQVSVVTLLSGTQRVRLGFPAGPADHLIRRVCRQCSRPGYIPCDLVGRHSLVRVISLSCAVLYGQIQASADQDHRLIPSMRTTGAYDDGPPPSAACPRCLWWVHASGSAGPRASGSISLVIRRVCGSNGARPGAFWPGQPTAQPMSCLLGRTPAHPTCGAGTARRISCTAGPPR